MSSMNILQKLAFTQNMFNMMCQVMEEPDLSSTPAPGTLVNPVLKIWSPSHLLGPMKYQGDPAGHQRWCVWLQ